MRTHNGLLVSLPGADYMKTGFICNPDSTWWRVRPGTSAKIVTMVKDHKARAHIVLFELCPTVRPHVAHCHRQIEF